MAKIKINNNREITLLSAKKNPNEKHIKIGNYFGELTTDISKTNGKPTLKLSKDGKNYYIREKFTTNVSNKTLFSELVNLINGKAIPINLTFGGKVVSGTLTATISVTNVNTQVVFLEQVEYTYGSDTISFSIPAGLTNGTIYFKSNGDKTARITITMTATLEE